MDNTDRLNIVNWNGRSILQKRVEFFDFLCKHNVDIATVSETWLKPSSSFYHPKYSCVRADRRSADNERGGGVLIAIRKGIQFAQLNISTSVIESVGVQIHHNTQPIHIIAVYFPGEHRNASWSAFHRDLRNLVNRREPFFIAGDLNARHRQWNCLRANKAGNILASRASSSSFFIHFPDTHTYHPHGGRRPSTLDLVLSNNVVNMSSLVVVNELSSDHLPVKFNIEVTVPFIHDLPKTLCYKRANWQLFKSTLSDKIDLSSPLLTTIQDVNDIDRCVEFFSTSIIEAESVAVPRVAVKPYDEVELLESTRQLIRLRNQRRRQWFRTRDPFLLAIVESLNARIRDECATARNQRFSNTIRNLDNGAKDVWKISKALRKSVKYSPPLRQGDSLIAAPVEKSNLLAESFAAAHRNPLPSNSTTIDAVAESVQQIAGSVLPQDDIPLIRPKELAKIIKDQKPRKAPGKDKIRNILLKNLPRKGMIVLTKIINACLRFSYFPNQWKHAIVTAIPKPGKDITLPTNYRPISLLPTMSKILERVVLTRIESHLENHDVLPAEQFGFKRGHSTNHQLVRLTRNIKHHFSQGKSAGMILLDVEKAYDSVWQDAILHKMKVAHFPLYIIKFLQSFLKERCFQVVVNGELSVCKPIPFGVPQGCVLSPALYNIFTADVVMVDGVSYYFFADDTGFVAADKMPEVVIEKLQMAQNALEDFQQRWKIKVNPAKTQAIFFTRRRSQMYLPQSEVTVLGQSVPWSDEVKYLGLTLDKKIKFDKHIAASLDKCANLTKMLYPLVCRRSRLNSTNKILLYKLVFRPILTYGFPAWHSCAQTHKKKLQTRQNKLLKMMLDLDFNHPTEDLHDLANTELIDEWTSRLLERFWIRCSMSENPLITNIVPSLL